jgi:hypothetical protein
MIGQLVPIPVFLFLSNPFAPRLIEPYWKSSVVKDAAGDQMADAGIISTMWIMSTIWII